MFSFFTDHEYMPCVDCGASLARNERDSHVCDERRLIEYELIQLRGVTMPFDDQLSSFFASSAGRFAQYCAERDRRRNTAD